jgi:hypothetical protein
MKGDYHVLARFLRAVSGSVTQARRGKTTLTSHRPSSMARGYQTWLLSDLGWSTTADIHSFCGSRMRVRFGKILTSDSRRCSNYVGCLTVSVLTLLMIGHGGTITTIRTSGPNVTQTRRVARELHVKTQHKPCHPAGGETKLEPRRLRACCCSPAARLLPACCPRVRVCASPASTIEATYRGLAPRGCPSAWRTCHA